MTNSIENMKDKVIGTDGNGFDLLINWCDDEGWISCGEEVRAINENQASKLVSGDLSVAAELFDYPEFEAA